MVTHRPTASLPLYQYSACGLANHPDILCWSLSALFYNDLVGMFVASLMEIE